MIGGVVYAIDTPATLKVSPSSDPTTIGGRSSLLNGVVIVCSTEHLGHLRDAPTTGMVLHSIFKFLSVFSVKLNR